MLLEVVPVGLFHAAAPMRARAGKGRARLVGALLMGRRILVGKNPLGFQVWKFLVTVVCAGIALCVRRRRKSWRRGGLRSYPRLTPQAAPGSPSRLSGHALSTPERVFRL
jgi:hypothetical protein